MEKQYKTKQELITYHVSPVLEIVFRYSSKGGEMVLTVSFSNSVKFAVSPSSLTNVMLNIT